MYCHYPRTEAYINDMWMNEDSEEELKGNLFEGY